VEGLAMEAGITVVDVATGVRFRPHSVPTPAETPVHAPRFPHQTRMERSDR
jgi:hypothetical protein